MKDILIDVLEVLIDEWKAELEGETASKQGLIDRVLDIIEELKKA